ncbi:hypothetical protein HRG_010503 [Hirsutella rhossiliensis]|uniref:Uncharacterized protein n=1 Tax=Hirsutella rhossiliensis TaxID=111463 RepID=A0A9P8MMV1_9HYPO|nr:uncharacterized protein HRG_10503 [Hirsutella rhossiliensis]KAH0958202.1 hypothetical protein HRG_10503 [Hirsutella rhossiliensis]
MQSHGQKKHGWRNPQTRGGDARFFKSRAASGWFEVGRASEPTTAADDPIQRIMQAHQAQAKRFKMKEEEAIRVTSDKLEPNAWLAWVGWAKHLAGLDPPTLRETTRPAQDDEPVLQ